MLRSIEKTFQLYCFVAECASKGDKHAYEHSAETVVVWNRLNAAGLSTGTVRHNGNPTMAGKTLNKHIDVDKLDKPPVIKPQ